MNKVLILLCFICIQSSLFSQEKAENFNFENHNNERPDSWDDFGQGSYLIGIDTQVTYEGEASAYIESEDNEGEFWAWGFKFPANKDGKKVRLTGYVKTENVEGGWAGLWMRIDPNVGFDNMEQQGITGTTDWKKYEIILDLKPNNAKSIIVGGILSGRGKMWLDKLEVTIDDKSLANAPAKKPTKAQMDTEFNSGSRISLSNLNKQQIDNATLLGKVWGFLKYHHPSIATGNYNWDYELFRVMESIVNAENNALRDKKIVAWINSYGEIELCGKCKNTGEDSPMKPQNDWMKGSALSRTLQNELEYLYVNRHQGKQFYIGLHPGIGNPDFKNEESYENMPYPDSGFRLLSLFRYWNMIQYFFPNRDITDKRWSTVLKEYVPRFVNAKNELEYEVAALQIIGDIKDTHANLWGGGDKFRETKGANYPPVRVRFIEDKLVVVDYFNPEMKAAVKLEIGDVITAINGENVSEIVKKKIPYYPASNMPTRLRDIALEILRSNDQSLKLTIQNDDNSKEITIPLFDKEKLNLYHWYRVNKEEKSYKMLENNIGYVSLANIQPRDLEIIHNEFMDTKGIIIDIRNYPSTFVVFTLGKYFSPGKFDFVKFTNANLNNPGEFTFTKPLAVGQDKSEDNTYKGRVMVLVNELSQSQAEYTAMAFKAAPNTVILGSTTAGADGNVSRIMLPGGLRTIISGIGVFYPNGSPTQRIGIVPDIEVIPTIEGIGQGRDEVLERAIKEIEKN